MKLRSVLMAGLLLAAPQMARAQNCIAASSGSDLTSLTVNCSSQPGPGSGILSAAESFLGTIGSSEYNSPGVKSTWSTSTQSNPTSNIYGISLNVSNSTIGFLQDAVNFYTTTTTAVGGHNTNYYASLASVSVFNFNSGYFNIFTSSKTWPADVLVASAFTAGASGPPQTFGAPGPTAGAGLPALLLGGAIVLFRRKFKFAA